MFPAQELAYIIFRRDTHTTFFVVCLQNDTYGLLITLLFGNVAFYVIFAIVHFLTCVALSAHIYYMGTWKLNLGIFKRIFLVLKTDCLQCAKPVYVDRLIVIVIGNAINWALLIFGQITQPKDFSSYLLAILIVNLLLYMAFYIFMKICYRERIVLVAIVLTLCTCVVWAFALYFFMLIRYRERIALVAIVLTLCTCVVWAFALYFFMLGLTSWNETPAVSRELNRGCILMEFYDGHDVWHFLSSFALFFSFLLVLVLDDNLDNTPRDKIPVF